MKITSGMDSLRRGGIDQNSCGGNICTSGIPNELFAASKTWLRITHYRIVFEPAGLYFRFPIPLWLRGCSQNEEWNALKTNRLIGYSSVNIVCISIRVFEPWKIKSCFFSIHKSVTDFSGWWLSGAVSAINFYDCKILPKERKSIFFSFEKTIKSKGFNQGGISSIGWSIRHRMV